MADILAPLPSEEVQHIMARLGELQTWLVFQTGKSDNQDADLIIALDIVQEARAFIASKN